jgi:4-aminobutyrate aminotransferase/(S)-3-amino-2-methylpropionate transaminase
MIPGPKSRALAASLARTESRGVTYLGADYPVFWEDAHGARVRDVDGNTYIDLTSAFGVATIGHANPAVVAAIERQAKRMLHGMGDVHPSDVKVELLERLAAVAPFPDAKTFLCSAGAEAVEFALKTALLHTGKPDAIAFLGAYHGLSLETLAVGGIAKFRAPFAALVEDRTTLLPFPHATDDCAAALAMVEAAFVARPSVGVVVVEPIQGRGGVVIPPEGWLSGVRALCDRFGAVLVVDEIYTGFGRTGTYWAAQREGVVPDLLCIGKALANGVPLSAVVGRAHVMDAWETSMGEALHTSTYLGNPLACAAAIAVLDEMERLAIPQHAAERADELAGLLAPLLTCDGVVAVRGRGFLWAVEFVDGARANAVVVRALHAGVIVLQSGPTGTSITIAPPVVIGASDLAHACGVLCDIVAVLGADEVVIG